MTKPRIKGSKSHSCKQRPAHVNKKLGPQTGRFYDATCKRNLALHVVLSGMVPRMIRFHLETRRCPLVVGALPCWGAPPILLKSSQGAQGFGLRLLGLRLRSTWPVVQQTRGCRVSGTAPSSFDSAASWSAPSRTSSNTICYTKAQRGHVTRSSADALKLSSPQSHGASSAAWSARRGRASSQYSDITREIRSTS